jgi:hypothetical protein
MDLPDQPFLDRLNAQCQRLIEYYDNLPDDHPDKEGEDGGSKFNFTISIGYNGFIYRSSFLVSYDGTLNIQNGCLQVSLGDTGYTSHVDANSPGKGCFVRAGHPYLQHGTKDVVTVLLTKFALNMPNRDGEDIFLEDGAKLRGTNTYLSPFNLVRGGDATYVKYGYESTAGDYDRVKDIIRDCTIIDINEDLQNAVQQRLHRMPAEDELLTDVMGEINLQNDNGLSDQLLEYICEENDIELGDGDSEGNLLFFKFDEDQGFTNGWEHLVQIYHYEDDWPEDDGNGNGNYNGNGNGNGYGNGMEYEGGRRKKSRKQKAKTRKSIRRKSGTKKSRRQ